MRPIPKSRLRDVAYEQIKQMIVSNRIAPGTFLSIDDFVQRLAISRTPIREALLRLQSEQLVEILPQRAVRVKEITETEVRELFSVRELLECAAVEQASQTIPIGLLDDLDVQVLAAEDRLRAREFDAYVDTDLKLHNMINQYSGNALLTELLGLILDRAKRIQVFSGIDPGEYYARAVTLEHRAVIDALRRRDAEAARRLLSRHLHNAMQRVANQLKARSATGNQKVLREVRHERAQ
jgi:DNA-binding GntR family transcriptional regulator